LIAIVGGRGVIGGAIAEALRADGHEVSIVTHDRKYSDSAGFRYGDMLVPETLRPALRGAEVVIQSANFPTYPIEKPGRRHTFMEFDGVGTERLVAAAVQSGASRYVFISGAGTSAGSAKSYYSAIWRGEQAVLNSRLAGFCLRPTLVFGQRDKGLNRILQAARNLPLVPIVGDGRQLHQPVYVGDVAETVRQAIARRVEGAFEIGGPERFSLEEMLQRLFRVAGLRRHTLHIPASLARMGARMLQPLPGTPLSAAAIDFIAEDFVADTGPLLATFDLKLTPFETGLRTYLSKPGV
jgi:NADH dehydrogenase